MRRIGSLTDAPSADRFVAFLASESIAAHRDDPDANQQIDIWVRDEGDVAAAREHLAAFQLDPSTGRFADIEPVRRPRTKLAAAAASWPVRRPMIRWVTPDALRSSHATLALVALMLAAGLLTQFAGAEPRPGADQSPLVARLTPAARR